MSRVSDFLLANPLCIFCGGETPATTVEHCPPKSLFHFKHWPEGFEFPACEPCNIGTGDKDAVIAVLARSSTNAYPQDPDKRFHGLVANINAQFPQLIRKMLPSHTEARKINRSLKIKPLPGQTQQEASPLKLPDEIQDAVATFSRKLSKAVYFKETEKIFPPNGCLLLRWFTNANVLQDGAFRLFEAFSPLGGEVPKLVRSRKLLNEQFSYSFSQGVDGDYFVLQGMFNTAFGLVVIGSPREGRLEALHHDLQSRHETDSPFTILQSRTLAAAA